MLFRAYEDSHDGIPLSELQIPISHLMVVSGTNSLSVTSGAGRIIYLFIYFLAV
jgi:hypothetical protein